MTFTSGPPPGDGIVQNIQARYGNQIPLVGAPGDGTITPAKLAAGAEVAFRTVLDTYSTDEVDTLVKGVAGVPIASAAWIDLGAAIGDFVDITGTTTITSFGTAAAGVERTLQYAGALTLTHNATSLILACALSITTFNGLVMRFRSLGSGNWQEVSQTPAREINANGQYVRFADGTQICWAALDLGTTVAISSAYFGGFPQRRANNGPIRKPSRAFPPLTCRPPRSRRSARLSLRPSQQASATYSPLLTTQAAAQRNVTINAIGRWFSPGYPG